ncbi:MAG TPA: hypothetical protein VKB50_28235 [Vicinamibacterales bacterium]|nr:hypothetical protein [Vicinamibacterales bacterium]
MAHDSHSHASADDQYRNTTEGSGHEHTDANVWMIVQFAIWLVVSAVIVHIGMFFMFRVFADQREAKTPAEFPLAVGQEHRLPAGPRLQRFPANEIYEFRTEENERLNSYGWIDRNAGTVHIPIADAMRMTLERGLPARPQAAPPDGDVAPGMMPQDSSSGRTLERRRQ